MKNITLFVLLTVGISCGSKRTFIEPGANAYYPIGNYDVKFEYADSDAYVIHKDLSKQNVWNEVAYSVREIQYSWGKKVETFFRLEDGNVLYYDVASNTESMIMPKDPKVGFKWISTDKAWEYEIVQLDGELETPQRKYSNLLVMKASQITGRDQDKLSEYHNYYQKGIGKVASVGDGMLMTYRLY